MAKEVITGAEALMRSLKNEDVKTIFGYPGGSIMPVFDALYGYTRGEKKMFDHILVRHEQAAAHAAQGYARVSGEVGVALVTSGPGATNNICASHKDKAYQSIHVFPPLTQSGRPLNTIIIPIPTVTSTPAPNPITMPISTPSAMLDLLFFRFCCHNSIQ